MKKNTLLLLLVLLSVNITFAQSLTQKLPKDASAELKATYNNAKRGDSQAQCNLGDYYYNGQGVTLNYAEAVKWYRLAAEQGFADAQNSLGSCYSNGQGVTLNYAEAVQWYRLAAEQGYFLAQYNLGVCYDNGQGIEENYTEAVKWMRLAAKQGLRKATEVLKNLKEI